MVITYYFCLFSFSPIFTLLPSRPQYKMWDKMVFKCHQKSIRIWQFVTTAGKNKETPATLHIAITQLTPLLWLLCRTPQFLAEEWFAMQTSARHSSNFWLLFKCFYWVISWCHLLQFAKTEMRERKPKDKKKSDYGYWEQFFSLPWFSIFYVIFLHLGVKMTLARKYLQLTFLDSSISSFDKFNNLM